MHGDSYCQSGEKNRYCFTEDGCVGLSTYTENVDIQVKIK